MAKPTASHAIEWVEQTEQSASVLLTAQRLIAIEAVIGQQLPAPMREGFAATQLKANELTLLTKNAALAAKLRQLQPRIIQQIKAAGWSIEELKIKVATRATKPETPTHVKQARALDETDLGHFENLSHHLNAGPLAEAVAKLLARHRR